MRGQVLNPQCNKERFFKVSNKTHTYGELLQNATSWCIPYMLTDVYNKTRCDRINKTYTNVAKCRQLFTCSQLGANHNRQLQHAVFCM